MHVLTFKITLNKILPVSTQMLSLGPGCIQRGWVHLSIEQTGRDKLKNWAFSNILKKKTLHEKLEKLWRLSMFIKQTNRQE